MELLGKKATKLKDLEKMGLLVPKFFPVPANVLIKDFDANALAKKIHKELQCKTYAVRSSALIEDADESSHAGQFMTEIDVQPDALAEAMKILLQHAKKYLKGDLKKFSLFVQEYISPDFAGVTFTRDPLGGREMLIEYYKGAGEMLVGGKIKPKQVKLFWNGKCANKKLPGLGNAIENFKKIEKFYKFPQDIEWCIKGGKFYFLQVRPITSLSKDQYEQVLMLDSELPAKGDYFYAKTEISEIAPKPNKKNFEILQQIYAQGGPVQKVYAKYGVKFKPKDFLTLIGGELFVDKEKELKTLMPAYSYFRSKDSQPHLASFHGALRTLKNIFFLNKIKPKGHAEFLVRLHGALTGKQAKDFMQDYELIFEINLLTRIAFNQLDAILRREKNMQLAQVLSEGLGLFPDIIDVNVDFDSKGWKGNSLDFSDRSAFQKELSTKLPDAKRLKAWWKTLPEFKRQIFEPKIRAALVFARLRELGRCLIVKHVNSMDIKPDKTHDAQCQLPNTLASFFIDAKQNAAIGVSPGIGKGTLTTEENLAKSKSKPILYAKIMSPNLVEHFEKVAGILTEEGGMLSHLAIMAREKGIPVVSQFNLNQSQFALGDKVEIDGSSGRIEPT